MMETALAEGLAKKISFLDDLSNNGAADIYKLVKSVSLPAKMREIIQEAVDNKLVGGSQGFTMNVSRPQFLIEVNNYFTLSEWHNLENNQISYQTKSAGGSR